MAKFFIQNEKLDNQIKEIRFRIYNTMNGVVSDSMREKGIVYEQNYGVDLPKIKGLAERYVPNYDLAMRLWALQIRETMILATLLMPVEEFTAEEADKWINDVSNIELAEQISMNLLAKTDFACEFSLKNAQSDDFWQKITGFTLAARIWKKFNEEEQVEVIQATLKNADTEEFLLYKVVAVLLARLCRRGEKEAKEILELVADFEHSGQKSKQYIFNEIRNEIYFLNF